MSGCGSGCGSCGSGCSCCGSGCICGTGCCMYPDVEKSTTTPTIKIEGVAPQRNMNMVSQGSSTSGAEGGHACKCGSSCTCNPCTC